MFKSARKELFNLIDNATVQPVGDINMLLGHPEEIEFVRGCFRDLFADDGGDLTVRQARIIDFMNSMNARIERYAPNSWKYPQKMNNVIYYLNLYNPAGNYRQSPFPQETKNSNIPLPTRPVFCRPMT